MSSNNCCDRNGRRSNDRPHWREPSRERDQTEARLMSTPATGAINLDELTMSDQLDYTKRSWVPSDPVISVKSGWTAWRLKKRPDTIHNPVRPDGTRRPSAYWTFWVDCTVHVGAAMARRVQGNNVTDLWRAGTSVPGSPKNLLFSNSLGNVWSKEGSNDLLFPVAVRNLARQRLRAELSETDWDVGVFAGEIRETASMFYDLGSRISAAVVRIAKKHGKSRREVVSTLKKSESLKLRVKDPKVAKISPPRRRGLLRRWEEAIINDWLVYQLGIKPLLHDVDSAIEFLVESGITHTARPHITVRKGAQQDTFSFVSFPLQTGAIKVDFPLMTRTACHYSATYAIGMRPDWVNRAGLNNPGSVLWNLTRFSFIVDYVVQVGNWLDSLVLPDNVEFLEGSESLIQRTVNNQGGNAFPHATANYTLVAAQTEPVSYRFDYGRFKRNVLSDIGVPPPSFPQVKNALNLTKVANVLAIIANTLK